MIARSQSTGVPIIPEPYETDPELERTRLYPTWDDENLYGVPRSLEEEWRQELEWSTAEHYRRQGDLQAEIAHYIDMLSRRPRDLAVIYYLGCTYLESGEPLKVIELIGQAHRRYPRLLDYQELLLEALAVLGWDDREFEWAREVRIFRLDLRTINRCHRYLKRKDGARLCDELTGILSREGCVLFSSLDLLEILKEDERFVVEGARVGVRRTRGYRFWRWVRWAVTGDWG